MKPPWKEDSWALPGLLVCVIALGAAYLVKYDYVSKQAIERDKDFYGALSSISTMLILLAGGVLSYIRFFKGRTLDAKMNLELKSGLVPVPSGNLHWVDLEIKNTGSVTIWHYRTHLRAILVKGGYTCVVEVTDFVGTPEGIGDILIDVGESAYEHAYVSVPKEVDAVTFRAVVSDKKGHLWYRAKTVKNVGNNSDEG